MNWKTTLPRTLHILVHLGSLAPLLWLLLAGLPGGRLGGDPVQELTHFLGKGAIHLLYLTLAVTPLARALKLGRLLRLRRPLGLWCFAWASLHFAVWLVLDLQFYWGLIGQEIVERNYLLVGFAAWLILLALAVTSIPRLMRAMKQRWKTLHSWIYVVAILAPVHYLWAVKSGVVQPGLYLLVAVGLLWLRRDRILLPLRGLQRSQS
ncbi:protein-methionine-sulfoxide reductase heme-binding subunit MsrQ [Gilvimarinus sp. F26214L]|uniref:protein-methionine-sulfoxide reductase heme-binding subunit MsrQ n=1 Tax=Gilvimarinus sp. DZF01 TaxID=3461371 RepID=UPI004045B92D